MNEWMDGWMDGWMDRWVGGWKNEQKDGWMDGRTDGWMDGYYVGGWDRPGETYLHHLYRLSLKSRFKVQLYRTTLSNSVT